MAPPEVVRSARAGAGPLAPAGYPFVLVSLLVAVAGWWLGQLLFWGGLGLALFFAYFFRDPEREIPTAPGLVLAPADGRVIAVSQAPEAAWQGQPAHKISIFMNIFDVHVNRAPVAGEVAAKIYQPGRYLAADRPEAPQQNEQLALELRTAAGLPVVVVQIAGLLARRIISYVEEGEQLAQGQRLGLICFGSRVDLYLPPTWQLEVKLGQKVKAGVSIIGRSA